MRDYSLLRGRIKEKLKNEYVLAEKLNCSKATLSKKLNDEVDFTQTEIENVCTILEIKKIDQTHILLQSLYLN